MSRRSVPRITPGEEAEVQRIIASDPEAAEATDEEFSQATSFAEACPELAASILRERPELEATMRRARGRPRLANARQQISIRLDADVLAKLKASGPGWQGRINEILRKAVG